VDYDTGPSRWLALPVVLVGAAVAIFVGQHSSKAFAEAAGAAVMVPLSLIVLYRNFWPQRWFWLFVLSVLLAHLCVLTWVDWPEGHRPSRADALMLGFDLLISIVLLSVIERRIGRRGD
jgi:hypothetical protein